MIERRRRVAAGEVTTVSVAGQSFATTPKQFGTSSGEALVRALRARTTVQVVVNPIQIQSSMATYCDIDTIATATDTVQRVIALLREPEVRWRRPPPVKACSTTTSASFEEYEFDGASSADTPNPLTEIVRELALEPVEDGVIHVAEHLLRDYLRGGKEQQTTPVLLNAISRQHGPDLIRLLGRMRNVGLELRRSVVEFGLRSPNIDLRDAAVQAVENWNDRELVTLLRNHHDGIPWLAEYIVQVIRELER